MTNQTKDWLIYAPLCLIMIVVLEWVFLTMLADSL